MVDKMGEFLSGAIAFEFSMENNEYGLVITPGFLSGQDRQPSDVPICLYSINVPTNT